MWRDIPAATGWAEINRLADELWPVSLGLSQFSREREPFIGWYEHRQGARLVARINDSQEKWCAVLEPAFRAAMRERGLLPSPPWWARAIAWLLVVYCAVKR